MNSLFCGVFAPCRRSGVCLICSLYGKRLTDREIGYAKYLCENMDCTPPTEFNKLWRGKTVTSLKFAVDCEIKPHHLKREHHAASTQAQKEKNFIGVCYFALLSLIIMITSFKRMWPLRELLFMKGISPGSLVRCLPLFALWDPLTHTDPCRRRKWNCLKLQATKSNRNSSYLLLSTFVAILTQGILSLDLAANVPRQPYSTRPLSKIFFFCFTVTKV